MYDGAFRGYHINKEIIWRPVLEINLHVGHLPLPHSQAIGEMVWQLLQVQTVTSAARNLAVPSEHCHMKTVKHNCIMHWTVAVMPIPFQ